MMFRLICRDSYQISPQDFNTFCKTFDVHIPLALVTSEDMARLVCQNVIGVEALNFNLNDLPKEYSVAGLILDALTCAGGSVHLLAIAAKDIDQDSEAGRHVYSVVKDAANKMNEAVQMLAKIKELEQNEHI